MIFFPGFFHLAHLALQNINNDYVIFLYFRKFIAKSDQKPKTKNGMNKHLISKAEEGQKLYLTRVFSQPLLDPEFSTMIYIKGKRERP